MMLFNRFSNDSFGTYDVILHATKEEAQKIMSAYNCDILPDCIPASESKINQDLYMFLIDSKKKIITPLWSFNYAYGRMYNAYIPVHEELDNFKIDLSEYNFVYFTKWDLELNKNKEREFWTDTRPVFRGKNNV